MKLKPRKKTKFLKSRWSAYAAAAGATTFGAAAAEAEIHYSGPIREKLNPHHSFASDHFPLNNGASFDLFVASSITEQYPYAGFVVENAPVSQGFRAKTDVLYAERLPGGQPVSMGNFERTSFSTFNNIRTFFGAGAFNSGGQGFIGFKFNTGAGTQYGWVRIKITSVARGAALQVIDYAYGDPGEPIKTGQTRSEPNESAVLSKSGSLGLLALGRAGLLAWRGPAN